MSWKSTSKNKRLSMVAKFKKWIYFYSTRAFVFNLKELRLFIFKEQTILIQLQERFIDSRML